MAGRRSAGMTVFTTGEGRGGRVMNVRRNGRRLIMQTTGRVGHSGRVRPADGVALLTGDICRSPGRRIGGIIMTTGRP